MRVLLGSLRLQLQITRRNTMDYYWILLVPFFALIFMAVLVQSGRKDLLGYALVGPLLVGIGQMGFYVASEVVARDVGSQTLELEIATPAYFPLVIAARTMLLTSLALVGFVESWLIARLAFGVSISVHHPGMLAATLLVTIFASGATALITSGLLCLGRSARAFQNTVTYPLYVISGVLVPASYLPHWLQPLSKVVFLSWSASLMRDSLRPGPISDFGLRLLAVVGLGVAALVAGSVLLTRMIDYLRQEGRLGV